MLLHQAGSSLDHTIIVYPFWPNSNSKHTAGHREHQELEDNLSVQVRFAPFYYCCLHLVRRDRQLLVRSRSHTTDTDRERWSPVESSDPGLLTESSGSDLCASSGSLLVPNIFIQYPNRLYSSEGDLFGFITAVNPFICMWYRMILLLYVTCPWFFNGALRSQPYGCISHEVV